MTRVSLSLSGGITGGKVCRPDCILSVKFLPIYFFFFVLATSWLLSVHVCYRLFFILCTICYGREECVSELWLLVSF